MGELIQNQSDATDGPDFADLTGREIGRYRIQKRLGRGGLTTVYQAYDMVDDFPVALKILLHGTDEKVYNRFRYEAQTAAKLQHPHIVRTLRVGVATGSDTAYIAMELVEGEDLATLLVSRRRLAAEESCLLLEPIAQALAYAHKRGVVHRDVKPSNILLRTVSTSTPNNVVLESLDYPLVPLLSDFGIARALDVPELTHSGRTVGTPAFMAPEQCLGRRNIDHRADLYALGAVFYRCITGRQPFIGSTVQILHAHVYEPVTIEEEIFRHLSQTHIQLLQRSLAKDPNDRYQSAEEMAADFRLGANPADLQMTADQHEQNTTLTLTLLPAGKAVSPTGPNTVLVPSSTDLTADGEADGNPDSVSAAPDVYYDPVLDRRLRKISGIVLFVLLLLIILFGVLSFMNMTVSDLGWPTSNLLPPLQSPVLAYDANAERDGPGVASGSGPRREARGAVWQTPTVTRLPIETSFAVASTTSVITTSALPTATSFVMVQPSITVPVAAAFIMTAVLTTSVGSETSPLPSTQAPTTGSLEPCTDAPDALLQPYLAQLEVALQPDFRCATEAAVGGDGELLKFQHGYMLYLYQLNKMFIVSTRDRQWDDVNLAWLDGDTIPLPSPLTLPEDGVFTPKQMFGKIWQNEDVRVLLGAALMPNAARFPVVAQKFAGGWVVLDKERPDEAFFFLRGQRRL